MSDKLKLYLTLISTSIYTALRYFLGTPFGILLTTCAFYFYIKKTGGHVFSPGELITWVFSQENEIITSILTTIITVIGFMAAYSAGVASWKKQQEFSLEHEFCRDLEQFSADLMKSLSVCERHIRKAIILNDEMNKEQRNDNYIRYALKDVFTNHSEWASNQGKIAYKASDYYDLTTRHTVLLANKWWVSLHMARIESQLDSISSEIWVYLPPGFDDFSEELLQDIIVMYKQSLELESYQNLLTQIEITRNVVSRAVGGIKGIIYFSILKPGVGFLLSVIRLIKGVQEKD